PAGNSSAEQKCLNDKLSTYYLKPYTLAEGKVAVTLLYPLASFLMRNLQQQKVLYENIILISLFST
ncbi:MAG TPA: hypothetical protein PKE57_09535, partial [Cellvibrionaceae bacterium]|nr:hypothetical protein [Cellvibrionaceae bacterium]